VPSNGVDDSKVVENVHVHFEIFSLIEDPLANLDTLIIDDSHVSSASTSNIVDVLVDSNTSTLDEVYIHEEKSTE